MSAPALSDLLRRPAVELAALVRQGEISARELTLAALARIEDADPAVNAFTHVDPEGALATADAIKAGDPRPFAGVPLAVKDIVPVEGWPLTFGSDLFGDFRPDHDAYVVRRLRRAGFVLVGLTNLPEMGIMPVTEPRRHGPTRNPWDLERTPGGSSGGAAAAVAAGMVPVAHGTDGGGSVRIPAAATGLVGLKPSRGRVSWGPDLGDSLFAVHGALSHTVADAAAMLDVMAGYEVGDATWAPPHEEPFALSARRDPGKLRIAFTTASPLEGEIAPAHVAAVHETATLLDELGHHVEEATPAWRTVDLVEVFTNVFSTMISAATLFGGLVSGRTPAPEHVEPLTWAMFERARAQDSLAFATAISVLERFARELVAFFAFHDVLLTPSLGQRPVPLGSHDPHGDDPWAEFRKGYDFTPFTALWNVSGQPAITVPIAHGEDGLPIGVQLAGAPLGEARILPLAAQLEAARPWTRRHPPG